MTTISFDDAHLHLQAVSAGAIGAWRQAGMRRGLVAAASIDEWPRILELPASSSGMLRVALGVHPWYLPDSIRQTMAALEAAIEQDAGRCIVAIGEVGLDGVHPGLPSLREQYEWLRRQCQIAMRYKLPVVLHLCHAGEAVCRFFQEFPDLRGIIHGYTARSSDCGIVCDRSRLMLSLSPRILSAHVGGISSANAFHISSLPLSRLLVESDAPNGHLPEGGEVTPLACQEIIKCLALIHNKTHEEISQSLQHNWESLFAGE